MQGAIHTSCCSRCFSHSPAESQLVQPLLSHLQDAINLTLLHVNAIRRCLAVRNGLYGHRWPGTLPGHGPLGHHCGGEAYTSPALTSCCWDEASQGLDRGEGWTFWDAVRASAGWGSASREPQAEWGRAQSTRWPLRLSARGRWVHGSTCTCIRACLALHSLLCFPLASRTAVRNTQASPEAFSSGSS